MQVRGFFEMFRLTTSGKTSAAGVSSFQALAMSLSGRIGVGNIAGIATAIAAGGPGAIFWMRVMALLGASTSYIECTLAQIYKQKDNQGQYRGGPAYYIERGMGQRWYAITFALSAIVGTGLLLPTVQSYEIANSITNAWSIPAWVSGLVVVALLGVIIVGGVRRIATFAEIIVPFMAFGYMLIALVIMAINIEKVPAMFALIVSNAFNPNAAFGAILGLAIQWGVKRGIYANEAGQGTGPHAAAAAEVSHPAKQGFVQAFSIYFDTAIVCTSTAFIILSTGAYNVIHPDTGAVLVENLPRVADASGAMVPAPAGAGYTQAAIESVFTGFGASFVAIAIMFFAFTTIVAYYYMAETNLEYIARNRAPKWSIGALKLAIMAAVGFGAVWSSEGVWALGSIGVGIMAWLNVIAIIIIQKPALLALTDYEAQRQQGLDPKFDPDKLGIANADLWRQGKIAQASDERAPALREPLIP
jgi:AGCS family alanine or glycine:cation symporter